MHQSVFISTGPETHLDHLGILAELLELPLILTDEAQLDLSQLYYPSLKSTFLPLERLNLEYLSQFDLLFECGKFWALELKPLLKLTFNKDTRFIFCPHGNSDKEATSSSYVPQDLSLVYGRQMIDLSQKYGVSLASLITTGNYRNFFYQQHKLFYDHLIEHTVLKEFSPSKRTILFAPTWTPGQKRPSVFAQCAQLIETLSSENQLIIKLHPLIEELYPAHYFSLTDRYKTEPGVLFLKTFPPIYPLLSHIDIYIGDFSSIGYDALFLDKPLYFFCDEQTTSPPLHACGYIIAKEANIYSFIDQTFEKNLFGLREKRKQLAQYAFGKEMVPPLQLKQQIQSAILKRG